MRNNYILAFCLLLVACKGDNRGGLPASTGKPYEVLVVAESPTAEKSVTDVLATPVEALPQREPQFDGTFCYRRRFDDMHRLARNIVVIDEDKRQYTKVALRYERNVYAAPQMVIRIQTPDNQSLNRAMNGKLGKELLSLLNRHELTVARRQLERQHNPKAEERIRQMFGINMLIPADMTASKQRKDFLWLSNNANTGMQNLCVFTGDIDSVLRVNIKGETDEMYLKRERGKMGERERGRKGEREREKKRAREKENEGTAIRRGLWVMEGDAMGGPYVARTLYTPQGKPLTVFAFVYAPESAKRNKMRQLEASMIVHE